MKTKNTLQFINTLAALGIVTFSFLEVVHTISGYQLRCDEFVVFIYHDKIVIHIQSDLSYEFPVNTCEDMIEYARLVYDFNRILN